MEFIIFDKKTHTYTLAQTGQVLPSVNQIIDAVYGSGVEFVPKDILDAAAKRGTEIHAEIEQTLKGIVIEVKYQETIAFFDWLRDNGINYENSQQEVILSVLGEKGFAGTADWICEDILRDYKTSKRTPTKSMLEHWQKQLSFYYYALKKDGKEPKRMEVLHLSGGNCTPIQLEYLGDKFVEDTLAAYYSGETLKKEVHVENALQTIDNNTIIRFGDVLRQIAALEQEIEPIREQIKAEMEKRNILALDIAGVSISYVSATKRKSFDSARFKEEHADMYKEYQKESEVKSSIRIKLKEQE